MGKVTITRKDLKGRTRVSFRDKDTGKSKGASQINCRHKKYEDQDSIDVSEDTLKMYDIHILDKIVSIKKNEEEIEIGTVNDFYTEEEDD